MIHFGIDAAIGAGAGYVGGAFTPSILRKIKAFLTKEATAIKSDVEKDVAAVAKKV